MKKPSMKRLSGLAIIATVTAAVSACSTGSPSGGEATSGGTVAYATLSEQLPVLVEIGDELASQLESEGLDVVVQDANFDATQQAQQLQQAINAGQIKGAWVFPVDPSALVSTVELAQSKQVPLVIVAAPSDVGFDGPQPGLVFYAIDYTAQGEEAGSAAAECVTAHDENAEVIYLQASSTAPGAAELTQATKAEFAAAAPGAQIVATVEAGDLQAAQTSVAQLLIAHPDASGVISDTAEGALGAVAAFQAAGKKADCVLAASETPDTLSALEAGDITAVVGADMLGLADEVSAELVRLISDPTAEGEVFAVPVAVRK